MNEALATEVPGTRLLAHAADRDAVQRADRGRALRRRDQALRRRPRDDCARRARRSPGPSARVPGAADVKLEQTAGLPVLRVRVDRDALRPATGFHVGDVLDTVEAIAVRQGRGDVFEGQRRFPLAGAPGRRGRRLDARGPRDVPVASSARARSIPLGQLADISVEDGPAQISREIGPPAHRRRGQRARPRPRVVRRGRASGGREGRAAARRLLRRVGRAVREPPSGQRAGCRWSCRSRCALIFAAALHHASARCGRRCSSTSTCPFAATGGIVALSLRGMPFSISAGVGFIALFGVAVLNGVVLVSQVRDLERGARRSTTAEVAATGVRACGCGRCS